MNFDFSDDQKLLRDELRRMLERESPPALARRLIDEGGTHHAGVWRHLVEMGATALMLPESCGGSGLGALELCVAAEALGRQLSPVPYASTMGLALQALLLGASATQQSRWLPRLGAGAIAALAAPLDGAAAALPRWDGRALSGVAPLVADGEAAVFAVVLAADAQGRECWVVAELDAGVARRRLATLDPSRPWAELRFDATPAERLDALDALDADL
ncbi:MAG: acyl-CoA dehydrogenase family protein, partial [Burkholderiales bacterium]|nr:acyl-CoA dehydrogenase family protein [Burkholderiales bacterium]